MSSNVENEAPQNKYEVAEIESIQQEIQKITKKIEHEKISLRILKERHEKKMSEYALLEGRPPIVSKEQKERDRKERLEKIKKMKYHESLGSGAKKVNQPHEEHALIAKDTQKKEIELENITKEINHQILENEELTAQINDLRKERVRLNNQLNSLKNTNKKIEDEMKTLVTKNKKSVEKIKFKELAETKGVGEKLLKEFENDRDQLEGKYHEIIETNIKRERDNKKELSNKRLMLSAIAESVKPKNGKGNTAIMDHMKMLDNDDITDRAPILDVLIDKWKFITKYKKNMIEKYIKNSQAIKEAFDKMVQFLGVESFKDLPTIYKKNEEQMNSIELYNSKLDNEIFQLENQKKLLKNQISKLKNDKDYEIIEKNLEVEKKEENIVKLEVFLKDLECEIEKKRSFFEKLEPKTFDFLNRMQDTFLSDFVPQRITINSLTKINESNVVEFLSCVENYCALIKDFDESTKSNNSNTIEVMKNTNKEIEKLKKDIEVKLDKLKSDNYKNQLTAPIKSDMKNGTQFDETIKKLSGIIANSVNASEDPFATKTKKKNLLAESN